MTTTTNRSQEKVFVALLSLGGVSVRPSVRLSLHNLTSASGLWVEGPTTEGDHYRPSPSSPSSFSPLHLFSLSSPLSPHAGLRTNEGTVTEEEEEEKAFFLPFIVFPPLSLSALSFSSSPRLSSSSSFRSVARSTRRRREAESARGRKRSRRQSTEKERGLGSFLSPSPRMGGREGRPWCWYSTSLGLSPSPSPV